MKYQITLHQLKKLADIISDMDGRNHPASNQLNAGRAHAIIGEVLGADEHKLYAPEDSPEAA